MTHETDRALTIQTVTGELVTHDPEAIAAAGVIADDYARAGVFADYQTAKAENTLSRHRHDLLSFADFLDDAGTAADGALLFSSPEAWHGVSFGIVEGFKRWLLAQGYAISTVNARLSTVRIYAALAHKADVIPLEQHTKIQAVQGYAAKEYQRVDDKRQVARVGHKKAAPTRLTVEQAKALKNQPDTPQGRRDGVLMCLLLEHGLRVSEVAALTLESVDLGAGEMTIYRPKVQKTQTHELTANTERAIRRYQVHDRQDTEPPTAPLLLTSKKNGELTGGAMALRTIRQRVGTLGKRAGVDGLSPHDCRHFWATRAARKSPPFALKQAGGWASMATVDRYVDESAIANEGIILSQD